MMALYSLKRTELGNYSCAAAYLLWPFLKEDITGPDNSASGIEAREKAETRARLEENMQAIREAME